MSLSEKQRQWIRDRDMNRCQMPKLEEGLLVKCGSPNGLEIHHIDPQRYAYAVLGLTEEEEDSPRNLVELCGGHHHLIHPDVPEALDKYREGNKQSFQEMQEDRDKKVIDGDIYWNDTYDETLKYVANERTDAWAVRGHKWPGKKKL